MWDALWARYPHVLLEASGEAVGLPAGSHGQLRSGSPHHRLGADHLSGPLSDQPGYRRRVVLRNPVLQGIIGRTLGARRVAASDGPAVRRRRALGHGAPQSTRRTGGPGRAWTGSSSTRSPTGATRPPTAGIEYVEELEEFLAGEGRGAIATVVRPLLRHGPGQALGAGEAGVRRAGSRRWAGGASTLSAAVRESYDRGETDEFILPTVVSHRPGSRG